MNNLLASLLKRVVRKGDLTITDADGTHHHFGDGSGDPVRIALRDRDVEKAILRNPELTLGETYMEGRWTVAEGSLVGLLTLFLNNIGGRSPSRFRHLKRLLLRRWTQRNTRTAARRNATHHYDVGNDIYALFLDEDWQYSCAYFAEVDMTLEEAQLAKKRHIASKMLLKPGCSVLDIGCGWGGMGLYLAKYADANVTGITLADNQAARASERAANVPNAHFMVKDYRAVEGTFDRIVSVGMFEHVGVGYYDEYFNHARRLMKDDGVMLLHSIGRMDVPGSTNPFIDKYIFPGGYVPAMSEVLAAVERSGLYVTDVEIWRLHYAHTLKTWRERFMANADRAAKIMSDKFVRMWEFYLAGSEASFLSGDLMVFQIQLARQQTAVPLTRDYIYEAEQALAERDTPRAPGPALVARRG
ncbi:MAG: cyclopropane-fatty-acyl-phospholipid synthase family protein [Devosia sp.]